MQVVAVSNSLRKNLADDELIRAEKYYTPILQNQYIVRRGVLRKILSYYLGYSADKIVFSYGKHGKPSVEGSPIYFNVSHSRDGVVVAVSTNPLTGIDIEYTAPIPDMKQVAKHHFSADEQAVLFSLDASQQVMAFYRCWTRKEAFIKADGRGLGIALDSFDVTLAPEHPPKILRIDNNHAVEEQWTMQTLPLDKPYLGAVLVFGTIENQRYWQVNFESLKQPS